MIKAEFIDINTMAQNVAKRALDELKANDIFISRWIPLTKRPFNCEERAHFVNDLGYTDEECDEMGMFSCELPDDGEDVLITVYGGVEVDTFYNDADEGCFFEGRDIDDVKAWAPLPAPYKAEKEVKHEKN